MFQSGWTSRHVRWSALLFFVAFSACSHSAQKLVPGDGDDSGVPLGDGGCSGRLYQGQCIADNGTCVSDNDCQNDTYCDCTGGGGGMNGPCLGGLCVPWGVGPGGDHDPSCQNASFAASDFKPPIVKCHWTAKNGGSSMVLMTPLVLDLNKDGRPEILFVAGGNLVAARGSDCGEIWSTAAGLGNPNQIAAADLDGDGFPEIVGITAAFAGQGGFGSLVAVFDHNGAKLATGSLGFGGSGPCSGVAIANVDKQGPPEILVDGSVFRYVKGNPQLQVLFNKVVTGAGWGNVSIFADLDGDGKPEVVTGLQILDGVTGADKTPANLKALGPMPGAYPAVADFNGDGFPDIVVVQSAQGMQSLTVFDYHNNKAIFGPFAVAGGGWGGTPTVGDYDADGVPDIGVASSSYYYVYALKCAQNMKPADCTGSDPGVLWQRATHDVSSGGTGSSSFDFNGDGAEEVVYRDECWLRVYEGKNGKTMFAQVVSSGTCLEYPVIADVDGDGHADLVVPSDNIQGSMCQGTPEGQTGQMWTQATTGVFVFTDPLNRWMPARPLWTSHSYHITEIKDDLSVPAVEPPSWKSTNTYRKNVELGAGMGGKLADYTGGPQTTIDNGGADCDTSERLWAQICNRGAGPALAGVPGAFYTNDPRKGPATPVCTIRTKNALPPGQCEAVNCDWKGAPATPTDLWFRANDDGQSAPSGAECKKGNDLLFLPHYVCVKIG